MEKWFCGWVVLAQRYAAAVARAGTRRTPDSRNITQEHTGLKIISHLIYAHPEQILG